MKWRLRADIARSRRFDWTPLLLLYGVAVLYALLCVLLKQNACGPSPYNTYTLQALAWRDGRMALGRDYPHLELAVFAGDWYVSFPPVPSIPLYLLTFLFGAATPDNLLVKLYLFGGCLCAYSMLRRGGYDKASGAGFALLTSFATALLSLTLNGAVWYQAQTLAYLLTMASCCLMVCSHPAPALLLYALAVGCRPFNAVYALPLFAFYFERGLRGKTPWKRLLYRLIPGVALGMVVACAYAAYNYARFGSLLEFGHNYLPEFSTQGGVQFSIKHVLGNAKTFLLGLPFNEGMDGPELKVFGFSAFIVHPVFVLLMVYAVLDAIKKRFSWTKAAIVLAFAVHFFLLLLHRTFGGYQFGARYTCDLLPYCALYIALPGRARRMMIPEALILLSALAFALYGACVVLV